MIETGPEVEDLEPSPVTFYRREGDEFWFDVQIRPDEASYHLKLSQGQAARLWTKLGEALGKNQP